MQICTIFRLGDVFFRILVQVCTVLRCLLPCRSLAVFLCERWANISPTRSATWLPSRAVQFICQKGLPRKFTGVIEYHGFKIRVQRPKSYTWELNTQLKDENLEYYKKQHAMYEQLQADVKDLRRDMKRTGEKLEKAYPDSESIKYGLTVAVMK